MRMRAHFVRSLLIALVAALSASRALASSSAIESLAELNTEMRRARSVGDWPAYLSAATHQRNFLNGSPLSRVEVARADMRLDDVNGALGELRGFVRLGQAADVLDSIADLTPLRKFPGYAAIQQRGAQNLRPVARSALAFTFKDQGLLPEDIDYDPQTRRFLVTSVLAKKIVAVNLEGESTDFAVSPDGWPILALKIDHARDRLWASEVALEGFAAVDKTAQGRSAILCYELHSGRLLRRIEAPRPSALGDIALTADGDVIASDGDHGGIYRVRYELERMVRVDAGDFVSPQTVAIAGDGVHIFVPDYVRGLAILSLGSRNGARPGRARWLSTRGRYALSGIDGLYWQRNRLIAVQNGTSPQRVIVFSLDSTGEHIEREDVVERSTATLGSPTHGVFVDGSFYYIANSGWDVLDDSGSVKAGMSLPEPRVMKVWLPFT